jgi:hypothetical protein
MAKLKNSFSGKSSAKLPVLGSASSLTSGTSKVVNPESRSQTASSAHSVVQALSFGSLHTKITGSGGGSQWTSAASGGIASTIGGGILSSGVFGFVGKLLSLFGGTKSTPSVPTPFVMNASQQVSLNIGSAASVSAVRLGVDSTVSSGGQGGPVYQLTGSGPEQAAQTLHVIQTVRQALLSSSSLNDVVSEI